MRPAPLLAIVCSPLLFFLGGATTSFAQYPGIQGAVEKQILELEQKKAYAAELIQKGDLAISDKEMDYESAFAHYKSAVDVLPLGGTASADVRKQALDGFSKAAYLLAKQRVSEGRYEDAKLAIDAILDERYSPNDRPALSFRSQLADPKGFVDRGTLTPQHVARIEEVNRLLSEAKGFEASGRFDLAFRRCEQALNLDKHNIAARRTMEQINKARSNYANIAYNETRSAMLADVSKAWELPVTKITDGVTTIVEQPVFAGRDTKGIQDKLDKIIIPSIEFNEASLRAALNTIRQRSIEFDSTETDPTKKGVNIIVKKLMDEPEYPITFEGTNLPLKAALDYIASSAGMQVKIDPHAVVFVPLGENTDLFFTKEYKVPPSFLQTAPSNNRGSPDSSTPESASINAKQFLLEQGVEFPEGASANYLPSSTRLIVKNTKSNLESIDTLVEASIADRPTQVEIEAKFLEVTQNNLDELGFDWLVGQFTLPGGTGLVGSGGTEGFGRTISNSDYPLTNPATSLPVGSTSTTGGPITSGNRGGSGGTFGTAIQVNAVDALLMGAPAMAGAAPGILSVAGVFTNPEFQLVLRALSQQKGVDLISAPKITTKSASRAEIKITRDFRYPTNVDPPQISQSTGSTFSPAAPNTPNDWAVEPVGITLDVEPTVWEDNYTIDLALVPRIIEFEGFINYGSPIFSTVEYRSSGTTAAGVGFNNVLPSFTFEATANIINRPVFSTRDIDTSVSVVDGQTVVMGGMMREDVQKVQDKVPILGDVPLLGRLFRSNIDLHVKRNLIIFVTARILDPAGQFIMDEVIQTSSLESDIIPMDFDSTPLPQ